jgi:ABC-type Fe3+-hydroxamate transport system substrate-binding protein
VAEGDPPRGLRVVSLVPSVTETLLAWGVEPVAVTRFCEQPGFRTVGGTKNPDVEAIVALAPDLVVMDEEENRREDADALAGSGVRVHVTAVRALADVDPCLDVLADAVGAARSASERATFHRIDIDSVEIERPPRVFVPIWRRPWMTVAGDTYGSSILAAAGFTNVFGERDHDGTAAGRYPTVTLDEVAALAPDLVLLPSEPYPFTDRHRAELELVDAEARLVDGRDLFWWGIRTPGAIARLRQSTGS